MPIAEPALVKKAPDCLGYEAVVVPVVEEKRLMFGTSTLVPGFVGWGSPVLNSFNYFGGFEDLAEDLVKSGWTIIIPQLGPLSSNWERACELYAQLTHGR